MPKYASTVLATALLVACSRTPTAVESAARYVPNLLPQPAASRNSYATRPPGLELQSRCARAARSVVEPHIYRAAGATAYLTRIHYSSTKQGCYAVLVGRAVEARRRHGYTITTVADLENVDARTVAGEFDLLTTEDHGRVTGHVVIECTLATRRCAAASIEEWYGLARAYLDE